MSTTTETTTDTATTDLAAITAKVSMLDGSQFDTAINVMGLIGDMTTRLRELKQQAEDAAIEYIRANGDQVIGEVRFYVGANKTTKPVELPKAAEALLMACGGDWAAFVDCLASGALKPGACRKLLEGAGLVFDDYFVTTETGELREGKPKLQKFDPRFVR